MSSDYLECHIFFRNKKNETRHEYPFIYTCPFKIVHGDNRKAWIPMEQIYGALCMDISNFGDDIVYHPRNLYLEELNSPDYIPLDDLKDEKKLIVTLTSVFEGEFEAPSGVRILEEFYHTKTDIKDNKQNIKVKELDMVDAPTTTSFDDFTDKLVIFIDAGSIKEEPNYPFDEENGAILVENH